MEGKRLPFNALQSGIVQRLAAEVPSLNCYCPLAPEDASLPFAVITRMDARDVSGKGDGEMECTYILEIYSAESRSFSTINGYIDSVCAALTNASLNLPNSFEEIFSMLNDASVAPVNLEIGNVQRAVLNMRCRIVDTL